MSRHSQVSEELRTALGVLMYEVNTEGSDVIDALELAIQVVREDRAIALMEATE